MVSKFQKESLKYTLNINAVGLAALLYFCDNFSFSLSFIFLILFYIMPTTLLHS